MRLDLLQQPLTVAAGPLPVQVIGNDQHRHGISPRADDDGPIPEPGRRPPDGIAQPRQWNRLVRASSQGDSHQPGLGTMIS